MIDILIMIKVNQEGHLERQKRLRDQRAQRRKSPIRFLSDTHFIQTYRLTRSVYKHLCYILREKGELKPSENISSSDKILRALIFYATGQYPKVVGNLLHSVNEIKKFVDEVTIALNHPDVVAKYIKFPQSNLDIDGMVQRFFRKYKYPGVLGCVDCCHFKIARPNKEDEHIYCRGVNNFSLKVQIVSDFNHKVMSVESKFGGATPHKFVWENSRANEFMENLHQSGEGVWLLGDLDYEMKPWLLTPYPDAVESETDRVFNDVHDEILMKTKETCRLIKHRWRCLSDDTILNYNPVMSSQIVIACIVLHNIALEYSVPLPEPLDLESKKVNNNEEEEHFFYPELGNILRNGVAKFIEDTNNAHR